MLQLSRIESGETLLELEPVDLGGLLRDIDRVVRPLAARRANTFTVAPDPEELDGVLLETDRVKLTQILINLLGNACKFTNRGEVALRVELDAQRDLARWHIEDTGVGIDPEDQQRIFTSFAQGHQASLSSAEGAGLGLSISSQLAQLLGGRIFV